MAKFEGLVESVDEVYQDIDLSKYLGRAIQYDQATRWSIAQDVIDLILKRTERGLDRNYKPLKAPYSESYSKSLAFKEAGKSKSHVNMKLFGDMLDSIDLLKETPTIIRIGFSDSLQTKKAFNHNTGDTLPKRSFFGVSHEDLLKITDDYQEAIDSFDIKELLSTKGVGKREAVVAATAGGELSSLNDLFGDLFDISDEF